MFKIPFNKPCLEGNELKYIAEAVLKGKISGDGFFTKKCQEFLQEKFYAKKILLTTSGTHALEIAALLLGLKEGDEVIVPSYTFPSTVNAFVLRGAKPKFVDIRPDTFNLDEKKVEAAISPRTKAIFLVHYAGVGCEMDVIMQIANKHKLFVVEDAAQGVNAKYKGKYLGTIGHLGAYSFHETKNYICGEGGALVINDERFIDQAEIIREKGTNRSQFFRGEIDKYTWVEKGSSYLPADILAAFLYAQLEVMEKITAKRQKIYNYYYNKLEFMEKTGTMKLPVVPADCSSNYHLFYLVLSSEKERNMLIDKLKKYGVMALFHYLPLHLSPMGQQYGYQRGDFPITERVSSCLLRLPFFNSLDVEQLDYITDIVSKG